MGLLILHTEYSEYGWKGFVVTAIASLILVKLVDWLAGGVRKRLPGYKKRRSRKKGIRR
jgi:hypothetical protein